MIALNITADDAESERYGKSVSDLQEDVAIDEDNKVTGTLALVTDYTGYSGEVAKQTGHYLSLALESEDGATIEVSWDEENWVDATEDGFVVARVDDHDGPLYVKATAEGMSDNLVALDLTGLTLAEEG